VRPARSGVLALLVVAAATLRAQDASLEYRVKAAYLFNFVKFVEWPPAAASGPLVICVAGRNPFGDALTTTVRGESVNGRAIAVRVIPEPDPGCHVVFVPDGSTASTYLRTARGTPTLTVGESADFLMQGGVIAFVLEGGKVRFDINTEAAARAELKISSRLLRVARAVETRGGD
jgi:hypothetical protein